jgi:YVTN family beta-propeller protein
VISPATSKVIGTVAVGKLPHWIATSSDGDTAYVTNEGSNTVTVVDVEKQRVLATIPVGAAPRKIVLQPGPSVKSGPAPASTAVPGAAGSPGTAGSPTATPPAQSAPGGAAGAVRIASFAFGPQAITVAQGTAVTWTNADSIPHTSTSKDKQWDSGPIQPGASFRFTLSRPGTYVYNCTIHPFMQATVVVHN